MMNYKEMSLSMTDDINIRSHKAMPIRFKKLSLDATAPKQATPGSAGFDLTAINITQIDDKTIKYETGIAVEIPTGFVGLLFPRSSCYKLGMQLTNCVGVIDSDYRGGISFVFRKNHRQQSYHIGDRVGQLVIVPIPRVEYFEVNELSQTSRGTGGYGSTGR